jgi:hypothetical protein
LFVARTAQQYSDNRPDDDGGREVDVHLMLQQCIDPLATGEPFESLPKL